MSTKTMRLIRDRGKGVWGGGGGGGGGEIIYLSLHCHHQNDFCIKMGGNESHFNVSVGSDGLFLSLFFIAFILCITITLCLSLSIERL